MESCWGPWGAMGPCRAPPDGRCVPAGCPGHCRRSRIPRPTRPPRTPRCHRTTGTQRTDGKRPPETPTWGPRVWPRPLPGGPAHTGGSPAHFAPGPAPNGSHPGARSLLPRRSPQCTVLTTQKKPCTPPAHVHFVKDFQLLQLTSPQLLTKWLSAHRAGGWARGASVLSEWFLWSSFNHIRCVDACGSFGLCSVWPTASVPLFTGTSPN